MASSSVPWKYDVFLSNSSQDAGNFSYLLLKGLKDAGILTYTDNQEVEGGGTASLELAITQSRFAIVILSPDYASSPLRLEQLVYLAETMGKSGNRIIPVFHHVSPSGIRKQLGTIGESFAKHEKEQHPDKVRRWRNALTIVSSFSGWSIDDFKDQIYYIKEIVSYFIHRPRRTFSEEKLQELIEQSVDEGVEKEIIEQPVDEVSKNNSVKDISVGVNEHINEHEEQKSTMDAASSAEWNFLLYTLGLEILSAVFDQASSPTKPQYALIGMLFAVAAVLTCIWELIHKKSLVFKSWEKLPSVCYPHPSDHFFESHEDPYGLVSSVSQFVFSIVQYAYLSHHADNPIRLSALPCLYLMCLIGVRLWKKYHKTKTLPVQLAR